MSFSHNKGYSAIDSGFAVGKADAEVQAIGPTGQLYQSGTLITATGAELNSLGLLGQKFNVTYPQVAAADVAKTFFIAPAACKIISAYERHVTVAGQPGTLTIEKLTTGEAPAAGDVILAAAFDITSTANTPVTKAGVTTAAGTLAAGDALCLKLASGAATSYDLGTISVTMQYV